MSATLWRVLGFGPGVQAGQESDERLRVLAGVR